MTRVWKNELKISLRHRVCCASIWSLIKWNRVALDYGMLRGINLPSRYQQLLLFSTPFKSFCFRSVSHQFQRWTCTGLEPCPCFPNFLARTTFSLFPCERLKFLARMLFLGNLSWTVVTGKRRKGEASILFQSYSSSFCSFVSLSILQFLKSVHRGGTAVAPLC